MIYILPTDTCFWIWCAINDIENYNKIYKIKKRDLNKPLAIMVQNFNWLKENTNLNNKQILFLKDYKRPFTILTNSNSLSLWLNYEDENWIWFKNRNIYKKIAIRIANNNIQKNLIKKIWPIFLTSANLSWKKEIYNIKDIEKDFSYYIKNNSIKLLTDNSISLPEIKISDIFEFIWDSLDIKYLRK